MNSTSDIKTKLEEKYHAISLLRKEIIALSKSEGLREVENYLFKYKDGIESSLLDFFGIHDELIVIHNMGKNCPYCTLWADGLSSSTPHIQNRCGFVLTSPNDYETMHEFAKDRDWKFPYFSSAENSFTADMGFSNTNEEGRVFYQPGFTSFIKKEGKIYRVASDTFGPGDVYSPIWHMIDMLHESEKEWRPKFKY